MVNNGPLFNAAPDTDEDELDLSELIGVVIENRWLIAAITAVSLVIGGYKAFTAVPIYRADGLLQVEEKTQGLTNLDVTAMLEEYTPVNAEMEILRSRSVLGDVVDNLKLDISAYPAYMPLYRRGVWLGVLRPTSGPMIRVDSFDVPDSLRGTYFQVVAVNGNQYDVLDVGRGARHARHGRRGRRNGTLPGGESITLFRLPDAGRT